MASAPDSPLGEYIRRQRELQELSLRQLADLVGISNPYLSQIERGLREPSEKVLDAIARSLELSAEGLYEQGGRRRGDAGGGSGDSRRSQPDRTSAAGAAGGVRRLHGSEQPASEI